MNYHQIEVDTEVLDFLKAHAEPFVDTPNSVLRKLLFNKAEPVKDTANTVLRTSLLIKDSAMKKDEFSDNPREMPHFPSSLPKALEQTLQVIFLVRTTSLIRTEATYQVAKMHNVAVPTVADKYCRQLGKKAFEVDRLLDEKNLTGFEILLINHYSEHSEYITDFFRKLRN